MASPSTNIKITATDKTQQAFKSVNGNVAKMQKGVGKLKVAFGALAGVMGARAFINFANQQLKAADTIGKMATKLQISTTALQTFRFAGEQSGETIQTMDNNLIKFAKQLGEAQVGIGLAKRELDILGISIRDETGNFKSHEQVLNEVADAFRNMDDPARKMSSAMALFGRSGHVMVNMLSDGSQGLAKLRSQLVSTGGIINEKFIREAEEANDAMNVLNRTFGAMATRLLSNVSPAILEVTDAIQRLMGLDPAKTMSLKRLRDEYDQLDIAISKTANNIRKLESAEGDLFGLSKQDLLLQKEKLQELMKEQHAIEVQIALHKQVEESQEAQKNLQIEQKKNEEGITKALNEQQMVQKHASQMRFMGATKILGAQQAMNKEHQETIDLLEEEYSEDFQKKEAQRIENLRLEGLEREKKKLQVQQEIEAEERKQALLDANAKRNREQAKRDAEQKEQLRRQGLQQTISVAKATGDILYEQGVMGFDAMRALAFTEAMVNAQLAATKALATLPPPWSYAAATASYAFAAARAYQIKNMEPPAREMGGTVTKGKPFLVGESGAEIFTPGQTGSITPNNAIGGTNVTFNIQTNDAQGFDQLLMARRGLIVSMINKAMHQQGRRALV